MANTLDSMKQRLNQTYEILYEKGIVHSRREFAKLIHKNPPDLSRAMNGNTAYLTDSFLQKASVYISNIVDSRWLRFGEGTWEPCNCDDSPIELPSNNDYKDEVIKMQKEAIENLTEEVRILKELCLSIKDNLNK